MTYGYIYKIEFPNGKHYIGLTTTTLEQRTKEHKCSAKQCNTICLYNALRKYEMTDTFELIEIDTADTKEELCELEIGYILLYNSYYKDDCGYNMTFGGEGTFGYIRTEEDKQKLSEAGKKQFESPESRQKQSERLKKYNEKPEARKKNSEALKKHYKDNPEAGQKISEAKKTYYENNPGSIQKNREAQKNRSPEWKIKKLDTLGQNKPFDVFTIDGIFVKTFTYQFKAMEYLQEEYHITSNIKICSVLLGNRNSSHGFVFKYK
jgi:predicted GIY-YIG superfamily endonuclease